jgi:hypothetical protein
MACVPMRKVAPRSASFSRQPDIGPVGCGMSSTFAEYEAYADLTFAHRAV